MRWLRKLLRTDDTAMIEREKAEKRLADTTIAVEEAKTAARSLRALIVQNHLAYYIQQAYRRPE